MIDDRGRSLEAIFKLVIISCISFELILAKQSCWAVLQHFLPGRNEYVFCNLIIWWSVDKNVETSVMCFKMFQWEKNTIIMSNGFKYIYLFLIFISLSIFLLGFYSHVLPDLINVFQKHKKSKVLNLTSVVNYATHKDYNNSYSK